MSYPPIIRLGKPTPVTKNHRSTPKQIFQKHSVYLNIIMATLGGERAEVARKQKPLPDLDFALKRVFKKDSFRSVQRDVIEVCFLSTNIKIKRI
jgi:hypothetical protein